MSLHRRGFSLAEVLISLFLLGLLGSLGVLHMRSGLRGADTHSLAMRLSDELRAARQQAIASQQPVALALPTLGGTRADAQAVVRLQGTSMARVSQVLSFANEHPGSLIFQGTWNTGSGTFTTFPLLPGQRYGDLQVDTWLNNPNITGYDLHKDFAMVFTPDGSVTSNGLPFFQGAYHWVVGAGASTAPSATPASQTSGLAPGLNYFSVTQVAKPWTIAVRPNGLVSVQSGLPLAAPGVAVQQPMAVSIPSGLPAITQMPASNPSAINLRFEPSSAYSLPAGVDATVCPGQRLTLVAEATDPSGRDLFARWTCAAGGSNSGPTPGRFSFPDTQRMSWNATSQTWQSRWDWMAPTDAQPGDRFNFQCLLGDGLTAVVASSAPVIEAIRREKIYTVVQQTYQGVFGEYLIRYNSDGSNPTYMADLLPFSGWGMTQDGSKMVVAQGSGYICVSARTGAKLFSVNPANYYYGNTASISPQGDRVAYWTGAGSLPGNALRIANIDGSNVVHVMNGTPYAVVQGITWSPDGTQLCALANFGKLYVVKADGTNLRNPLPSWWFNSARWSADGRSLWVCNSSGVGGKYDPCRYDLDTNSLANGGQPFTNIQAVSGGIFSTYHFGLSPDGSAFYTSSNGSLWRVPVDGSAPTKLAPCPLNGGAMRGIWAASN